MAKTQSKEAAKHGLQSMQRCRNNHIRIAGVNYGTQTCSHYWELPIMADGEGYRGTRTRAGRQKFIRREGGARNISSSLVIPATDDTYGDDLSGSPELVNPKKIKMIKNTGDKHLHILGFGGYKVEISSVPLHYRLEITPCRHLMLPIHSLCTPTIILLSTLQLESQFLTDLATTIPPHQS